MDSLELKLSRNSFLLSETDEKGIIRYANDEFCTYSGFPLEELIGKSHNIVRHPDMPKAAFADLWKTIQSGKAWKGFVKNRSKNGKYYWVFATVFPFNSCDGTKGYISCRRMASNEEVEKYEKLYKTME
ncbi:PAS sensor domain-containing protein [Halarcobacter ebronensis]|uniref:PAS sensor domain-containing protein n=1 Tax=Halarcobacter ebronensis TaxID=1462615 RepID=A0A4Q0YDI4_9BACT|nr:PAS domain-containing protein [Halarcobacter ebronensis]RXJ68153.1 PAS sensor domain-containing protein [Halarcobacter ebronensis]